MTRTKQEVGWVVLERLHAEAATSRIPVLIGSTLPDPIERAQGLVARFGGVAYLANPFNRDELLEAIADQIGPAGSS